MRVYRVELILLNILCDLFSEAEEGGAQIELLYVRACAERKVRKVILLSFVCGSIILLLEMTFKTFFNKILGRSFTEKIQTLVSEWGLMVCYFPDLWRNNATGEYF